MIKFCKKCGLIITTNEKMKECYYCDRKLDEPIWKDGILQNKKENENA
jgi:hypothetical protein